MTADPARRPATKLESTTPTSAPPPRLRVELLTEAADLDPYLDGWDALAVASRKPFCAPAWMLAWWAEERSGDARLRVSLVFDGERMIAAAPFFAQVGYGLNELRLLSAGFSHRIGIVAEPGREEEAARVLAPALASIRPTPASIVFEGIDARDPWPELLADAWVGRRPILRTDTTMDAPVVQLGASYDEWFEGRSRNFRKESRRHFRRLQEEGVTTRIAHDPEATAALMRLHEARWEERGGSDVQGGAARLIDRAATSLGPEDRLQVVMLETAEGPISAELVLRADGMAALWAGGFDPAWGRHAPGTQTMLAALQAVAAEGVETADLGGGFHAYKRRMADENAPIVWRTLFPRGARYPLIRLRLAPKHARRLARRFIRERGAGAHGDGDSD
jgi:CelD/BcsL family acetyltransferase involved in cellulose biosynthesis